MTAPTAAAWNKWTCSPTRQGCDRLDWSRVAVGCEAYGVESLRDDLARFTFLLGEGEGEGLFSPRTPD
jgi:hypothetical protein